MKKILFLFILLLLANTSFSSWQTNVALSVFASFLVLILIYAVAFGFEIDSLKVTTKEEMIQLIFTIVIAFALVGAGTYLDDFGESISELYGNNGKLQDYSLNLVDNIMDDLAESYSYINEFGQYAMSQSSRTYICVLFSTSFFVSACNSYALVSQSFSIGMQAIAVCFAELQALYMLLSIGENFAFSVFLPFGLFLRTFKFSRGAGAFFIAIGVAFYFFLPLSVVFMEELNQEYEMLSSYPSKPGEITLNKCNEQSTGASSEIYMDNPNNVKDAVEEIFSSNLEYYIYLIFIRTNLMLFISLFVMVSSIRWLGGAFGAEIDISAIARFA